jgi:hypothetical protein
LKIRPHAAFADLTGDLIMAQRLADHEGTLHVDSRSNAMRSRSEIAGILAKL